MFVFWLVKRYTFLPGYQYISQQPYIVLMFWWLWVDLIWDIPKQKLCGNAHQWTPSLMYFPSKKFLREHKSLGYLTRWWCHNIGLAKDISWTPALYTVLLKEAAWECTERKMGENRESKLWVRRKETIWRWFLMDTALTLMQNYGLLTIIKDLPCYFP